MYRNFKAMCVSIILSFTTIFSMGGICTAMTDPEVDSTVQESLWQACLNNDFNLAAAAIHKNADVHAVHEELINGTTYMVRDITTLMAAVSPLISLHPNQRIRPSIMLIDLLIKHGIDVCKRDSLHRSAYDYARVWLIRYPELKAVYTKIFDLLLEAMGPEANRESHQRFMYSFGSSICSVQTWRPTSDEQAHVPDTIASLPNDL